MNWYMWIQTTLNHQPVKGARLPLKLTKRSNRLLTWFIFRSPNSKIAGLKATSVSILILQFPRILYIIQVLMQTSTQISTIQAVPNVQLQIHLLQDVKNTLVHLLPTMIWLGMHHPNNTPLSPLKLTKLMHGPHHRLPLQMSTSHQPSQETGYMLSLSHL